MTGIFAGGCIQLVDAIQITALMKDSFRLRYTTQLLLLLLLLLRN